MFKTSFARTVAGLLTVIPVFSGITYILLANLQQHVYGELGVRPADVGLDHSRIVDETFGLTVGFAVICTVLAATNAVVIRFLLRRKITRTALVINVAFWSVFALTIGSAFVSVWASGTDLVAKVKQGSSVSSTWLGGLHLLDIDAVPFRFNKLARDHPFDHGCVLYLGRADGRMVFYDTQRDEPIWLREDEYDGEPLAVANAHAASRCDPPGGDERLLVRAARLADVDIAQTAMAWSEQQRPHGRWWLMASNDLGVPYALSWSTHALDADLGRNAIGHLVVTYRGCPRPNRCALRVRDLIAARNAPFASPRRRGCSGRWPVSAMQVAAVLLTGPHCPPRSRGVWIRRTDEPWTRVPTTGATVGQLDAFDSQVAWLERRGPVGRVRTLLGAHPQTLFLDSMGLDRLGSDIQSVRVIRGGVVWTARVASGSSLLLSHINGQAGCQANGEAMLGEPTEWAFGGGRSVLATASRIYASTERDVVLGTGEPFTRRGASGLATVGCPT